MIQAASTTVVSFPKLGLGPWNIERFLFEDLFGVFSVAWYGVIICISIILAGTIILRNAVKKEGFVLDSFLDYFLFCVPIGIVGARVMYVLAKWEEYESFGEMIAIWHGGIAIYGAVIAGALTVLVVAKVKKHNPLKVYDAMVPGLLLAQAIGRWGNFINGEAFGEPMKSYLPWGMIVNGIGPVHPTFLYESLITFSGFLISMFVIYRFKKINGQVFCFYLVWYGIGRVLVEGLRSDSLMIGSLRLAQCIGIASALLGIALFVILQLWQTNRETVPAEGITLSKSTLGMDSSESEEESDEVADEVADEPNSKKADGEKAEEDAEHGANH